MKKGFTLVESLLYIAILSVMVVALSAFLTMSYTSRVKASVIAEVEQQGSQTLNLITQNIRNSASVTTPAIAGSGASLTLTEYTVADSPTVINQSGNALRITEGANIAINITSNRVVVSNLLFQNLTRSGTPGNVKISFTLTHVNPDNRGEYIYSKSFTATASLRYP